MKLTVLPTLSAFLRVGVGSKSPLTLQASSLVVVSPLSWHLNRMKREKGILRGLREILCKCRNQGKEGKGQNYTFAMIRKLS